MARFEDRKLVEMVLYILNRTGGTDFYHVFKILYFAELKHLAKWGRNITTEKEMLDASIEENANLTFRQLLTKSHDEAWKSAYENGAGKKEMSLIEMAKATGVDDGMLDYIGERLDLKAAMA